MYKKPNDENTGATLKQDAARIADRVEAAVHTALTGLVIGGSAVAPALYVAGLVATNPSADKYPGALSTVTNMLLGNSVFQGALLVAAGVLATAGYQFYQAHMDKKKLEEKMNGGLLGNTDQTEKAKILSNGTDIVSIGQDRGPSRAEYGQDFDKSALNASKQTASRMTNMLGLPQADKAHKLNLASAP